MDGDDRDLYSLQEVKGFLDETFGKVFNVSNWFPSLGQFEATIAKSDKLSS